MKKFTFKNVPKVGKWRAFDLNSTEIKLGKSKVGMIAERSHLDPRGNEGGNYVVSFRIISIDDRSGWKWVTLAKKFTGTEEAKEWLSKETVYIKIQETYELSPFEG
jgi:hypothetical protein